MENTIFNIIKENNVIGKGTFGKIYYYPESYPNYIVKQMKKYDNFGNNFIVNNIKELWWYSLISNSCLNQFDYTFKNIPNMLSYHVNSEYIYLLLEYRGTSISNKIKQLIEIENEDEFKIKHIELLKIIPFIIYQCSKILLQIHYASMRHGDITTSNILIDEKLNTVSIIDWGSIVFNKTIMSVYNQCANDFSSPELKMELSYEHFEQTNITIKSDIFSLGLIILYIIDPFGNFVNSINEYIKKSEINDYQHFFLGTILKSIKNSKNYISEYVNEDIFILLSKMLESNTETRIDIDSLYNHQLFIEFIKNETNNENLNKNLNKYFLRNVLKKNMVFTPDIFKNLIINNTYKFIKKFKSNSFKNVFDTRVILTSSIKLFYTYLSSLKPIKNIEVSNTECNICKNTNINHYIISLLCSIKWIDCINNDDISVYYLYEYYVSLYNLLYNSFTESILLDLNNFLAMFDLTFFQIFKKLNGIIFYYHDAMDFIPKYISYNDIKKNLLISDTF